MSTTMLEQPESPSVSQTKQQVFDHYLYRLQSEIHMILSSESGFEERIHSLENELEVFKRACFTAESEKRALGEEVALLRQKADDLESQRCSSENRIVCLIDGNGTIFSADLLTKGEEGGRLASKLLRESIHYHLTSSEPCDIWTYIFFNKTSLLDMLAKAGGASKGARDRFEEFMLGFNQSCERFVMTDVGNDDEAVVAKVKAHLDYYTKSWETYRVVFGGCHNNAYMSQLHAFQMSPAFCERLVLLPGYAEMGSEIKTLQLPSLIIPGLFRHDRFGMTTPGRSRSDFCSDEGSSSYGPPPGLSSPTSTERSGCITPPPPPYPEHSESKPACTDVIQGNADENIDSFTSPLRTLESGRRQRIVLGRIAGPVSYRPMAPRWAQDTPQSPQDSYADVSEGSRSESSSSRGFGKQRRINRDIPLGQHNPPPCTLFYLAANGCRHGSDCRFGHDYILDDEDYEALKLSAKKVPCPSVNRGIPCVFGVNCCYGHSCPYLTRCHYFRVGQCKFRGVNMHQEEEDN